MSFEKNFGPKAIDYFPCRYGASRLVFRGPRRRLDGDYITYLGGIETYGKFMPMPYPIEMEVLTGRKSVNLGCSNIGIDSYLNDRSLIKIAEESQVVVIEAVGAHNMTNRYYAVHPRRNDRFIRASARLRESFPQVDFTDFSFTRHLLSTLRLVDDARFAEMVEELREAWVSRMTELIGLIRRPIVMVWLADHDPSKHALSQEPLFVDRRMIETLPNVIHSVEVVAAPEEREAGLEEMIFNDLEQPAAEQLMGPVAHRRVAQELMTVFQDLPALR